MVSLHDDATTRGDASRPATASQASSASASSAAAPTKATDAATASQSPGAERANNGLLGCLTGALERRAASGLLRAVRVSASPASGSPGLEAREARVDFASNDYMSLAGSATLEEEIDAEVARMRGARAQVRVGSTGSRLLTGTDAYYDEVEQALCAHYGGESALLFNSGYDCNLGLLASLPQPGDVVLFDELMHNSVREGLKLARGSSRPFKHNDVADLRASVEAVRADAGFAGNVIVSVESVYSMDGHVAPLAEMAALCQELGCSLVVDEAHGVGVFGEHGRGLVAHLGLQQLVFCCVFTFGKALGAHGAVLVGPKALREYMVNYCRPLIYSTSLPAHSLATARAAHTFMAREAAELQRKLHALVEVFQGRVQGDPALRAVSLASPSAIQGVIVPGNENVVRVAAALRAQGFDLLPIRSPTVPKGTERIRVILHAHNTADEVHKLLDAIKTLSTSTDTDE